MLKSKTAIPSRHVYISAAYCRRNDESIHEIVGTFREAGVGVVSSWLLEDDPLDTAVSQLADDRRRLLSGIALRDIDKATDFLAFTEDTGSAARTRLRGGRHVELGYAIARGRDLWLIGPVETIFHSCIPADHRFESVDRFIDAFLDERGPWAERLRA